MTHPSVTRPVLALLLLALAACGGGEQATPNGPLPSLTRPSLPAVASGVGQAGQPRVVAVTFIGGALTGESGTVPVAVGTPVRLTVIADVADVLVVEGYDVRAQVTVGDPVQVDLVVGRAGTFTVTLEKTGTVLTTLRVS